MLMRANKHTAMSAPRNHWLAGLLKHSHPLTVTKHARANTYMHTYIYTDILLVAQLSLIGKARTTKFTFSLSRTLSSTNIHMHAHIHTYTHTPTNAPTRAYTHKHTPSSTEESHQEKFPTTQTQIDEPPRPGNPLT